MFEMVVDFQGIDRLIGLIVALHVGNGVATLITYPVYVRLSFFTWREIPCEPVGKVPTTSLGKNSGMGFRSEEIVRRELEK